MHEPSNFHDCLVPKRSAITKAVPTLTIAGVEIRKIWYLLGGLVGRSLCLSPIKQPVHQLVEEGTKGYLESLSDGLAGKMWLFGAVHKYYCKENLLPKLGVQNVMILTKHVVSPFPCYSRL